MHVGGNCHGDEGGYADADESSSESGTDNGSAGSDHGTLGAVDGGWARNPPGRLPHPVSLGNTNYAAIDGFWHGDGGGGGNSNGSSSNSGNAHGDYSTIGVVDG